MGVGDRYVLVGRRVEGVGGPGEGPEHTVTRGGHAPIREMMIGLEESARVDQPGE